MNALIIFYSANGNTEYVAQKIGKALKVSKHHIVDVNQLNDNAVATFDVLILGCPTWSIHDLPCEFGQMLGRLSQQSLNNKTVALFGTGNQKDYPESFANAMGLAYQHLIDSGCKFVGKVSTHGYSFTHSLATIGDMFVGLPIDEDTQSELTDQRIKKWVSDLVFEMQNSIN